VAAVAALAIGLLTPPHSGPYCRSDCGGQPTPVRAAQWLARNGGVPGIPDKGWREISRDGHNALVVPLVDPAADGNVAGYLFQS
jgi:hypothetical protein